MVYKAPKPRAHPKINSFLENPVAKVDMVMLASMWQTTRVTMVFERPPDLEGGMRLVAAIRGALGEPLKQVSQERYGSGGALGTPFHAFYADHCMFQDRWHVPKPFVIWCEVRSNRIFVEISLFGEAGQWKDDVIEAMLRVMLPRARGGSGGITLMFGSRVRRPWKILDVFWCQKNLYLPGALRPQFVLSSMTPVVFRGTDIAGGKVEDGFFSLFARLAGLARWHGVSLDETWNFTNLRKSCKDIEWSNILDTKSHVIERFSRTYTAKPKLHAGFDVRAKITGYADEMWPGFVLGTLTHWGYDTVQGYGRYAIQNP